MSQAADAGQAVRMGGAGERPQMAAAGEAAKDHRDGRGGHRREEPGPATPAGSLTAVRVPIRECSRGPYAVRE